MGQDIHVWIEYDKVDYTICPVQIYVPRDYDLFGLFKKYNRGIHERTSGHLPVNNPDYH